MILSDHILLKAAKGKILEVLGYEISGTEKVRMAGHSTPPASRSTTPPLEEAIKELRKQLRKKEKLEMKMEVSNPK